MIYSDWQRSQGGKNTYYNVPLAPLTIRCFTFDMLDDMQKQLYRQGMAAFGGIAPTYHIELLERPTIVWDFHSLLLGVQMMFSFIQR